MILKIIDNNQQDYQSRTATFSSRTTLAPLRASCRAAQEPFIPAPYTSRELENIKPYFFHDLSLLQMKYILFVGGNAASTDNIKRHQAIWTKIRLCRLSRNRFCTKARKKGAQ